MIKLIWCLMFHRAHYWEEVNIKAPHIHAGIHCGKCND